MMYAQLLLAGSLNDGFLGMVLSSLFVTPAAMRVGRRLESGWLRSTSCSCLCLHAGQAAAGRSLLPPRQDTGAA
jgi:hypothetical protein